MTAKIEHRDPPKKRGPKPMGDRAMTAAERKQRSRMLRTKEGQAEFSVFASGDALTFIDWYAGINGVTRTEVVTAFLDLAVRRMTDVLAQALTRMQQGESAEDALGAVGRELATKPDPAATRKLMEVIRTH